MSRGLGAAACVVILVIAGAARAQPEAPEPLAIAYEAPEGCPSSSAFFREITARTTRARAALPGERARVMHVVVTKRGDEHAGRLWIEDANTSSSSRSVGGKTCGEVVGALALIGALAVDPRASTAPIAAASSSDPARREPAAPGAPAAPAAEKATSAAEKAAPAGDPLRAPEGPRARDSDVASPSPRGRLEVGVQAELATYAGAVPSGRVFVDLSIGPREGLFAPAVRLSFARSLDVDEAASIGGATLRFTTGGLEVCPVRVVIARPLAFRPCGGGSAGALEASGTGVAGSVDRSRPWVAVSALGRLVWEPLSWLDVELEAGAAAPLYRESFFFAPSVPVYEAPPIAFLTRAGVGVRFP